MGFCRGSLTPHMLIKQINRQFEEGQIAHSTFRIYKSAVMYWLGQQAQAVTAGGDDPVDYASAYETLRTLKYS